MRCYYVVYMMARQNKGNTMIKVETPCILIDVNYSLDEKPIINFKSIIEIMISRFTQSR